MLNVASLRSQFPALQHAREGRKPIFLDGPGGTQVPQRVVLAMVRYLSTCNANTGGEFTTSRESDHILQTAHNWLADFLNAPAAEEIIFGPNMTTLTLSLSRAFGKTLKPGDEVLVTRLDHDANVTPWVLAAQDTGATVRWVDFRPEDCTLNLDDFRKQLSSRTKLVAVTCASNATGSLVDVATVTKLAHQAGALVYLDAVHYAPHGPIDVQAWGCDFLACSGYKFFGPHVGILWGKRELLEKLPAYKLRPSPNTLPGRWMTGTQNHEGLAGLTATIDYLTDVGKQALSPQAVVPGLSLRRLQLRAAMHAIQTYEQQLARKLLQGLAARKQFKVLGITAEAQLAQRVPTVSVVHSKHDPATLAKHLAQHQIYAWNGNMYALNLSEKLGLEQRGGFLRLGLVHYNTEEEIDVLLKVLDTI